MVQKLELKNGQKHVYDVISKPSSAEPQQQQQRKAGRTNHHVQDVAKQPSGQGFKGFGGQHQPASNGVANGRVESERGVSGISIAPVNAAQNGNQGRTNGNSSIKPEQVANGRPAAVRSQSNGSGPQPNPSRPGATPAPHESNGINASGNGVKSTMSASRPDNAAAVPAPAAGGRGRDASGLAGTHSNGGAAAGGVRSGNGDAAGQNAAPGARPPREPRRRGGRGRGGSEASVGGADISAGGNGGAADGDAQSPPVGTVVSERQDRTGRPRGGRRQGRSNGGAGDVEGGAGDESGLATVPAGDASVQGNAERAGQRSGRPRGRRGRGGQPNGAPEGGDPDTSTEVAPGPRQQLQGQATGAAPPPPPEARSKQQRQPREPRSAGQQHPVEKDGAAVPCGKAPQAGEHGDQQPPGEGGRPPRGPRRGKEPRPLLPQVQGQSAGQPQSTEAGEHGAADAARSGSRGQGRGGRRRNGGAVEGAGAGDLVQEAPKCHPAANGDGDVRGQRLRPARPPRASQPQSADLHQIYQQQQPVEQPPAAEMVQQVAQHEHPQLPSLPQPPLQQQSPQPPLPQQSHQQMPPQQQFQAPLFQEAGPLMDYPQSLLQHMVPPQHHYPLPPEFQQHFMPPPPQQHQHQPPQFDPVFQHFQHQQAMQQHMPPPMPPGHNFLGGGFGGPAPHMPPFYGNPYGQMLAPPPPPAAFGGAPAPPMPAPAMHAPAPEPQQMPTADTASMLQHSQAAAPREAEQTPPAPAAAAPIEAAVAAAVAEPKPHAVPEVPAAEPVKNEWADRLAQRALARMTAVNSSLISGGSSSLEGLGGSGTLDERPRSSTTQGRPSNGTAQGPPPYGISPRGQAPVSNGNGVYATEPETWRTPGETDLVGRRAGSIGSQPSETWRNGATNGPAATDGSNVWRSSLAPTGVADNSEAWRMRNGGDEAPEVKVAAPYQPPRREESPPPPPASAGAINGRPRLNLQPRTKPLPQPAPPAAGGPTDAPAANGAAAPPPAPTFAVSRSSIFGAARPREEVLRERGVAEPERLTAGNVANAAANATAPRLGGRAGSVTSGASDEDQWQTVGKGGRSKPPPASSDVGNALLDATSDPFFTGRATTGHGVAIVGRSIPAGRVYGSGGSYGKGSHGSGETYMNAYGASRGYGNSYGNEDDEPIFKRGLPTRNNGPF